MEIFGRRSSRGANKERDRLWEKRGEEDYFGQGEGRQRVEGNTGGDNRGGRDKMEERLR